ncbi:MAG: hypothetical protein ACK5S6_01960 [bacterium]|jgi:hypothetical protein
MPLLTSAEAVQQIIDYDQELIPDLTPFLDTAVALTDSVIGTALADPLLEQVQKYLTAHFVGITDPRLQTAQVKSLLETYQVKLSLGLGITHFGQVAMTLDTSGKLAAWNTRVVEGKGRVQFFWAGTRT